MHITDTLISLINYYFDPRDLLAYLMLLQAIDIVTGVIVSARFRRISSSVAWKGITRKAATLVAVFFLLVIEHFVSSQFGSAGEVVRWVMLGFTCVEGLSIIENLGRLGIALPSSIGNLFSNASPARMAESAAAKVRPKTTRRRTKKSVAEE